MGDSQAEMDSTIEKGVIGVGEGSVCASLQNIIGLFGEQLVRSYSYCLSHVFFIHRVLVTWYFRIIV